jgi:hypothetical protein
MTEPRFRVTAWPPFDPDQTFHVWDNQTHGEVVGRWNTHDQAQAWADQCNAREEERP